MKSKKTYRAIGMMSGTSLDGLDIVYAQFTKGKTWNFDIRSAMTISYPREWKQKLATAHLLSGEELLALDVEYGHFLGSRCREFISRHNIKDLDLIASHGHTIFHQPLRRFTFQLGNGPAIYSEVELPLVYDFRSLDLAWSGEGAPLVPVGDRHLFSEFEVCLNLGGIANLSIEKNKRRIAFDICYANMGLNYLAQKKDLEFDKDGRIASRGEIDSTLLAKLEAVYRTLRQNRPSLGREGFELNVLPLLNHESIPLENRMITFCKSIADEIRRSIVPQKKILRLLATGGGAHNRVLMKKISEELAGVADVEIPGQQIVEFKEGLVFAFLGILRLRGEINVLKSVTRSSNDSCSGSVIGQPG